MDILIDMDDVMEDLISPWVEELSKKYGLHVTKEDVTVWDMESIFPTLTKAEIFAPLHDEEFWKKTRPIDGAVEYINKLIMDGNKIYITTCSHLDTIKMKMEHLVKKYFPMLSYKNIIIAQRKQMIKGDILIDDYHENLIGGDYEKILVDAPYNRNFNDKEYGFYRVHNWKEIYETVNIIKNKAHKEKTMREILLRMSEEINIDGLEIMYRTYTRDGLDILCGYCKYDEQKDKLIPMDGDSYSLSDKMIKYELNTQVNYPYLMVWYESEWITSKENAS